MCKFQRQNTLKNHSVKLTADICLAVFYTVAAQTVFSS
uniref:Uncharacterized protein n=1 Tax=Anguilla anguilla TaxID=7936 RepID=A0A0E9V042_ANGAN